MSDLIILCQVLTCDCGLYNILPKRGLHEDVEEKQDIGRENSGVGKETTGDNSELFYIKEFNVTLTPSSRLPAALPPLTADAPAHSLGHRRRKGRQEGSPQ